MESPRLTPVCVLVLSYNRKRYLKPVLEALREQTHRPDQVVVIDNNSTDGSPELVEQFFPDFHLLRLPANVGCSGGYYAGMQWAMERSYQSIWLLDDDVRAAPDALERLLSAAQELSATAGPRLILQCLRVWDDGVSASLPALQYDLKSLFVLPENLRTTVHARYPRIEDIPAQIEVMDFPSEGVLIPRDALERCGLYIRDLFFFAEDTEYAFRTKRAGFRHFLVSTARIHRLIPADSSGQLVTWKLRYWIRSVIWIRRMYGETWAARSITPWFWAVRLLGPPTLKGTWFRDPARYRSILAGLREGLFQEVPRQTMSGQNSGVPG